MRIATIQFQMFRVGTAAIPGESPGDFPPNPGIPENAGKRGTPPGQNPLEERGGRDEIDRIDREYRENKKEESGNPESPPTPGACAHFSFFLLFFSRADGNIGPVQRLIAVAAMRRSGRICWGLVKIL